MIVHLLSENLQKKISLLNKAISTKSQLPILLNILIETRNGKLYLSSTDLEIGIQIEIPANIEEEGATTVPAKTFSELINTLPSGKITFQTKDNSLEVITSKTKSAFQTIPKEEFPNLYEEKGEEALRIKRETLHKFFTKVIFAASIDTDRPALSGVLIKPEEKGENVLIVATDGYRLSLEEIKTSIKKELFEKPLLIPARVLREVMSIKEGEEIIMYIASKNNQVMFENEDTLIIGRLIEAEFPNYELIIPQEFETKFSFDREEMQKAVKICAIFARETANIIKLSLKEGQALVSANTLSSGENTVEIEGKLDGEENEIAFNARYLLDLFANVEENEMSFEMNDPLKPGVFRIQKDPSFLHLIMPIRVQG